MINGILGTRERMLINSPLIGFEYLFLQKRYLIFLGSENTISFSASKKTILDHSWGNFDFF